jgi:hypothetical protein
LIFTKRLYDVFDDEFKRIAGQVGSREKAFKLATLDKRLEHFYQPPMPDDVEQPVWSVICKLSDKIGEKLTDHLRSMASLAHTSPILKPKGLTFRSARNHICGKSSNHIERMWGP